MNPEIDQMLFKFRENLKLEVINGKTYICSATSQWLLPESYKLDFSQIHRSGIIRPESDDPFSKELFKKIIKDFIEQDFVEIQLVSGIVIKTISWKTFKKLLVPLIVPETSTGKMSVNILLRSLTDKFEIIDPERETILEIDQKVFSEALNGKQSEAYRELYQMGLMDTKAVVENHDIYGNVFHFLNSRNLDPKRKPEYVIKSRWNGQTRMPQVDDDAFTRTLKIRRSLQDSANTVLPLFNEIKDFLALVCGADSSGPRTRFFYPSPGGGYCVSIKVLIPVKEGVELYDFNPIANTLVFRERCITKSDSPTWIRILCVGDETELKKRYNVISYRLLLLETGVLLQQLSLVAAYKRFKGRILGYTNEKHVISSFPDSFITTEKIMAEYQITKSSYEEDKSDD